MKYFLPIFSFVVLCFFQSNSNAAPTLPTVIALFGDSTTVGYVPARYSGDPEAFGDRIANGTTTRGTPTIHLNDLLNDSIPPHPAIVTNWGYGGTATAVGENGSGGTGNGLGRISSNLATAKATHSGSEYYVLIIYGTNDLGFGIGENDTRFNIEEMINISRSRGFEPIIGSVTPRSDRSVVTLNTKIKNAANNKSAFFVDHFNDVFNGSASAPLMVQETSTTSGQPIYLHPSREGYRQMAQEWFDMRLKFVVAGGSNPAGAIAGGALLLLFDDDEEIIVPPPS